MKKNDNRCGLGLVAVACLLMARAGAEEPMQDVPTSAEETIRHGFGVGVVAGEPTGLSAKKWLSNTTAIDAAVAQSFSSFRSLQIHADLLWHNFDLIKIVEFPGRFPVYYGVGGRIKLKGNNSGKGNKDEDMRLGMRVPVGVSYLAHDTPMDFYAEVVPFLDVSPETKLGIGIGVGARYYF